MTLTAVDAFHIHNVGTAYAVMGIARLNPRNLVGERVTMVGKWFAVENIYVIERVETFAVSDPTGMDFAVVVKDSKREGE
jgi:hypothetical protein